MMLRLLMLLMLLVSLLTAVPSWAAAVTYDSKFEKNFNSASSPSSFVSNAGTVSGSVGNNANRVLIVAVCLSREASFWGNMTMKATKGGSLTAMTLIQATDYALGLRSVRLYGLAAPDTGNITLEFSWDSGQSGITVYVGAISVYNADQVTGWTNSGADTGAAGTGTDADSTVTTTAGNMVIVAHGNDNASSTVVDEAGGHDSRIANAWLDTCCNTNAGQAYFASDDSSALMGWNLGSAVAWANVKTDVIAASAGAGRLLLMGVGP
jgi:hypothetical protein